VLREAIISPSKHKYGLFERSNFHLSPEKQFELSELKSNRFKKELAEQIKQKAARKKIEQRNQEELNALQNKKISAQ
jgi:hypothetical protein